MTVNIIPAEFMAAVQAATNRYITAAMGKWAGHLDPVQTTPQRLYNNIIGAMAEMAVAKAFNKWFVPRLNTFHNESDVLEDVEVRSTTRSDGSLIIRDNDPLSRRFILVVVTDMTCHLKGWCYGYEREALGTLRDPNSKAPAYFIPQPNLHDMQSFVMDF
jgi:hypothetical protein